MVIVGGTSVGCFSNISLQRPYIGSRKSRLSSSGKDFCQTFMKCLKTHTTMSGGRLFSINMLFAADKD